MSGRSTDVFSRLLSIPIFFISFEVVNKIMDGGLKDGVTGPVVNMPPVSWTMGSGTGDMGQWTTAPRLPTYVTELYVALPWHTTIQILVCRMSCVL